MEQEDQTIAMAAGGDQTAFDTLYRRYITRVYRYAVTRARDAADADDLTSQTFLAALIDIGDYRGTAPFAAWLFGIAHHTAGTYYRRAKSSMPLDEVENMPHPTPPLDTLAHQHLQLRRIITAMNDLTPERAEALRLRIFGELSSAEVAHLMRRSVPAVKMLIHRAIADLRRQLNADGLAEGWEED